MGHAREAAGKPVARGRWVRQPVGRGRLCLIIGALCATLSLSVTMAVAIGPVHIPPLDAWRIGLAHALDLPRGGWSQAHEHIVVHIRFPRVLLASIVGGGLAVVGVILQAAVRNPIADPYILGISSGASVGAVLVILFGMLRSWGIYATSAAAFLGGLTAFAAIYLLARDRGRIPPMRIVLSGIAVSYLFSSITSFLILKSKAHIASQSVLYWLMGSVAGARWEHLGLPALVLLGGTVYLVLLSRSINILVLGDETAITLGVRPSSLRKQLLSIAALLTGIMVAISGGIGFVALMLPHAVRMLVGADHGRILPVAMLVGAIYLVWLDVLARTLLQPEEIPITIITAFVGAPFLLWLMRGTNQWSQGGY